MGFAKLWGLAFIIFLIGIYWVGGNIILGNPPEKIEDSQEGGTMTWDKPINKSFSVQQKNPCYPEPLCGRGK